MSAKEQKHSENKVSPKPHSPKPITSSLETTTKQPVQPAAMFEVGGFQPSSLIVGNVLQLQRTVGNRAVGRVLSEAKSRPVIQAKLTVGAAHDPYEQEADRVADQVMRMPATPTTTMQRTAEDEEELQAKPLASALTPLVQRATPEIDEEELQTKRATAADGFDTSADFEGRLNATRGGGRPLPDSVREFMEPRFGADFSGVRLHTGSEPTQLNREVSAQAFTLGQDIYLGEGKSDLESNTGKQLLAHELTHVVQQTGVHEQAAQPNIQPGAPTGRSLLHSDRQLQAMWVKDSEKGYIWIDAKDTTGYKWTKEWHDKQDLHPGGYVYVKDDSEDSEEGLKKEAPIKLLYEVMELLQADANIAITFMSMLSSKDLWSFASTGKVSRGLAQNFCIAYLPHYEDRFVFNLATKGLLLTTSPSEKYGGKEESGKPHATSGYKWYQAALTGKGPIVLGDLKDYQTMRDYKQYMMSKEEAEDVEKNAQYLMAWPWSLLVNAALVTGAIHGGRPVIGATEVTPTALYKKPDMKDTFGLSVYARELIQLVLKHGYQFAGSSHMGVTYPEPGLSGGNLLLPPKKSKKSATIFDVGEQEEKKYDSEEGAKTLVSELNAPEYKPIQYPIGVTDTIEKQKKPSSKQYDALRKRLKSLLKLAREKSVTPPQNIQEMVKEIYPAGIDKAAKPSIHNWQIGEFGLALNSFEKSLQ